MKEAWNEIKQHTNVYITIDLFFMGLVFLEKRPQKENFVVRFWKGNLDYLFSSDFNFSAIRCYFNIGFVATTFIA